MSEQYQCNNCNSRNPSILRETDGLGNCILQETKLKNFHSVINNHIALMKELE